MGMLHFPREREELAWFFAETQGTAGLRGASLEFGGGVFDDAAQDRLHERMLGGIVQQRRRVVVSGTLTLTSLLTRATLRDAFSPFGAGRANWRVLDTLQSNGVRLIGLIVGGGALERLMKVEGRKPSTEEQVLFLQKLVESFRGNRIPGDHPLSIIVERAALDVSGALFDYAEHRKTVRRIEHARRVEESTAMAIKNAPWLGKIDEAELLR